MWPLHQPLSPYLGSSEPPQLLNCYSAELRQLDDTIALNSCSASGLGVKLLPEQHLTAFSEEGAIENNASASELELQSLDASCLPNVRRSTRFSGSWTSPSNGSDYASVNQCAAVNSSTGTSVAIYKCKFCTSTYKAESFVRRHIITKHKAILSQIRRPQATSLSNPVQNVSGIALNVTAPIATNVTNVCNVASSRIASQCEKTRIESSSQTMATVIPTMTPTMTPAVADTSNAVSCASLTASNQDTKKKPVLVSVSQSRLASDVSTRPKRVRPIRPKAFI